tara:strand:- start:1359 stop:1676 length:318 start_codon:yes stop_codon:yes gene_type:complete
LLRNSFDTSLHLRLGNDYLCLLRVYHSSVSPLFGSLDHDICELSLRQDLPLGQPSAGQVTASVGIDNLNNLETFDGFWVGFDTLYFCLSRLLVIHHLTTGLGESI